MAKKPAKPNSGSGAFPRRPRVPESTSSEPGDSKTEFDDLEGELSVTASELDELESRLNARLSDPDPEAAGGHPIEAAPEPASEPPEASAVAAPARTAAPTEVEEPADIAPVAASRESEVESVEGRAHRPAVRGFGATEWAALAGCALLALVGGALFFKFLYAHRAPTQGAGLPAKFHLPLVGPSVRLSGADAGWRERIEVDKARSEEVVLPVISLTLDSSQASSGFVRVEFVDPDDKIRGDIQIAAIEGGRFKDGGRGEIIGDGGLKVELTSTVGFRSHALFRSYMAGQEPRWSVRIKEGPDSSNGPWTELGAALIPNTKH